MVIRSDFGVQPRPTGYRFRRLDKPKAQSDIRPPTMRSIANQGTAALRASDEQLSDYACG
jgi:hypothetical protein